MKNNIFQTEWNIQDGKFDIACKKIQKENEIKKTQCWHDFMNILNDRYM